MRARARGFSVIEMVIVLGLAGVLLTLLYRLLVSGSRTVSLGSEEVEGLRRANLAMERLKRDLRASCDIVTVNAGAPEITGDGRILTFKRFSADTNAPAPGAFKVVYRAEKTTVKRGGQSEDAVRLRGYYGDSTTPVLDEDVFTDVRFKKYWLNGSPFYQIRLAVPDRTGKGGQVHYLQSSVGSRYYHTLLADTNWLPVEEGNYVDAPPPRTR